MAKPRLSPDDITGRLRALAASLKKLEHEASRLSYAAVSGDKAAAERLGEINSEIEGLKNDRVALMRANDVAVELQTEEEKAKLLEERRAHWAKATRHRESLVKAAKRMEALVDEIPALKAAMLADQQAIRAALRATNIQPLREPALSCIVGRNEGDLENLTQREIDFAGRPPERRMSDQITYAWRVLDDGVEAHA
jgi:hypothetical protein